jgi:hypothetical protein
MTTRIRVVAISTILRRRRPDGTRGRGGSGDRCLGWRWWFSIAGYYENQPFAYVAQIGLIFISVLGHRAPLEGFKNCVYSLTHLFNHQCRQKPNARSRQIEYFRESKPWPSATILRSSGGDANNSHLLNPQKHMTGDCTRKKDWTSRLLYVRSQCH